MFSFISRFFRRPKERSIAVSVPEPPRRPSRSLTSEEADILRIVQEEYGPHITENDVTFTPANEAHLTIKGQDGQTITAISLTDFASFRSRGEVTESELRNDWIRDSRTMLNHWWNTNPSAFRLMSRGTSEINLVLIAGPREIEVWSDEDSGVNLIHYIFYPGSMHRWDYPFHVEPVTKDLQEDITKIVIKLLEDKTTAAGIPLKVTVKWEGKE